MKYAKLLLTLGIFFSLAFLYSKQTRINSFTSVKDPLSSSQLSYFARAEAGTTQFSDLVPVVMTGGNTGPSVSTSNLFTNDVVAIGRTGADTALDMYTVSDIASTSTINLATTLSVANGSTGVAIIATRTAIHTVYFTPETTKIGTGSTTGPFFELLIKATNTVGKDRDGIPDNDGFDLGMDVGSTTTGAGTRLKVATNNDVICPVSNSTASVGVTIVISGSTYHRIMCPYTGTNSQTGYTMSIGASSFLINPSPSNSTEGLANSSGNVYNYFVRFIDTGGAVLDSKQGKLAVVESVRVTATIDPTITFQIGTTTQILSAGNTACGVPLSTGAANTTATSVAFGSVSIAAFNSVAQMLSIVTNAASGYAITTFANQQLTLIGDGTTIPPTVCDSGPCTTTSDQTWITATNYGFGYGLENVVGTGATFTASAGSEKARPFPVGAANAVTIISNASTPAQTERYYVCYRLNPSTTQKARIYENKVTYTATATF